MVVRTVRDSPPPDLLACPIDPVGFPAGAAAAMPPAVRDAAIRLAQSRGEIAAQLRRLIRWSDPEACGAAEADR